MLQLPQGRAARRVIDTEATLIAAGRALEPLVSAYLEACREWETAGRKTDADAQAAFPGVDFSRLHGTDPAHLARQRIGRDNGYDAASDRQSKLFDKIEKLAKVVRATPPQTIEGLRAHALIAICDCQPCAIDHDGALRFDDEVAFEALYRAVVNLAGVSEIARANEDDLAGRGNE
jgi:hypothetical protein